MADDEREDTETASAAAPVVRVGCREAVCYCHDDGSWTDPGAYPEGCSSCGCRRL